MAESKTVHLGDIELYPPFEGFPPEGIEFLKRLKRNNNRPWFEKHKQEYEAYVKQPMQSLIAGLQPHFEKFAPDFDLSPKRSFFRIYRDVRFSSDKTPYKTHAAAHFVLRGKPKGVAGSGYYLHIEPGEVFLGGGIYMPDGDQLKNIRRSIDAHADRFLSILRNKKFISTFKKLESEKLKRVPKGYDPDHPMAEWLKQKQFFVGVEWPESRCKRKEFVGEVSAVCEAAAPLVRFLNEAVS